jgi:putative flippase GtrA
MIKSLVYFLGSDDYKKRIRQFFQFCVVGGLGAVVNISLLYSLTEHGFHFHYILSGAISIEIAFVFNFLLNRVWTFNHIDISGFNEIIRALIRDHAVRSVGMGINLFFYSS